MRLQPGAHPTGDKAVISGASFILRLKHLIEAAYQDREARDDVLGFPLSLSASLIDHNIAKYNMSWMHSEIRILTAKR